MSVKAAVLVLVALVCCLSGVESGPIHASCKITWTWSTNCTVVQKGLVEAISNMSGTDCGSGEKCRYKLVSQTSTEIKSTHTTPVHLYVDDQTFTFTQSGSTCTVKAYSTSETWYAVLDSSTNYCNLHNLVTNAGLDKMADYREDTSDSVCTQYSSRNCDKY